MIAYHFTQATLRGGRPIPAIGKKLVHERELKLCVSGLHASLDPFDALKYAPGCLLHKVEVSGEIIVGDDKLVASERTILASIDATKLLCDFARWCALDVAHLWDCPPLVLEYLQTGDESLRAAARDAVWAASQDAVWAAARAAARDAVWAASQDAARAAAWAAARAAAEDASQDAARAAAQGATRKKQRVEFNRLVQEVFK